MDAELRFALATTAAIFTVLLSFGIIAIVA